VFKTQRAASPHCRASPWAVFLAAGTLLALGYLLLPVGLWRDGAYFALGIAGVTAIIVGIRRNRPANRTPWIAMAVGQAVWVLGDCLSSYYVDIAPTDAYPTLADACYLAAYPLLLAALFLLIRDRLPRRDLAGILDSAVVTTGLATLSWCLLARPTFDGIQTSPLAASVGAAYPIADILLVGGVVRLLVTPGGRTRSFWLLLGAVLALVGADSASTAMSIYSNGAPAYLDVIWLLAYIAWGAAALEPSMRTLSDRSEVPPSAFGPARLTALALATLVAPGILAVEQAAGLPLDVWAVVVGSVLAFLLVVARMGVAIRDIAAANAAREQLQLDLAYQAAHDPLTDLPNRAQAMTLIDGALRRARRSGAMIALLFVDLDKFKTVNDTFGHRAGDLVLRAAAKRMQTCVRGGDVVARLGGDEFVVLLEPVDHEAEASDVAERIIAAVCAPIEVSDTEAATIGASVGIALSLDASVNSELLMHEADTAVYRAKTAGRGRAEVFDDRIRQEIKARNQLTAAVSSAIRDHELHLVYQPIVDLATGEICSHEALVRWRGPDGHPVVAADFLPAAESSELIFDLDRWVLHSALGELADEIRRGRVAPTSTVAVNISARHLSSSRILTDVADALGAAGVEPQRLALEIAEAGFADDPSAMVHLTDLRAQGIHISLDDVGTDHRSVLGLPRLPLDTLKVDRRLIDPTAPAGVAVLRMIIDAAHAHGVTVVGKGVETQAQADLLRGLLCDAAQGYFFARPAAGLVARARAA
jgi:diguanylate cyclase (GGDEF)-like protein